MLQRASLTKPGKRTDLTYTKEAKLKDTIHINEEETGDAKKKKDAAVNSLQNMAAIIAFIIMTGFRCVEIYLGTRWPEIHPIMQLCLVSF